MAVSSYRIRFTRKARQDLEGIYQYYFECSGDTSAGERVLTRLESAVYSLSDHPWAGSPVRDAVLCRRGYRKCIAGNYVAFYLVDDSKEQIVIVRILHGRRNHADLI